MIFQKMLKKFNNLVNKILKESISYEDLANGKLFEFSIKNFDIFSTSQIRDNIDQKELNRICSIIIQKITKSGNYIFYFQKEQKSIYVKVENKLSKRYEVIFEKITYSECIPHLQYSKQIRIII